MKTPQTSSKDMHEEEPFHHAVRANNTDGIIDLLLSQKANTNTWIMFGWKSVHIVVVYGNAAVVEQFI
jgi:ankyrin repeat protein